MRMWFYVWTSFLLFLIAPASFGTNLVTNGEFSGGNTGFFSDYPYGNPDGNGFLGKAPSYAIDTDPRNVHNLANSYKDHTTGSGKMMVVNGATSPGLKIWNETIAVTPNTDYLLSVWVSSWTVNSPANLQVYINSVALGGIFDAPNDAGRWVELVRTWNSGSSTSADIYLENMAPFESDDFALDDICFSVPEPTSLLLLGLGGLALRRRIK